MTTLKITATAINANPLDNDRINDTEVKGFHVRFGKPDSDGKRRAYFYVKTRVNGRQVNKKIANCEAMTPSKARSKAISLKDDASKGIDIMGRDLNADECLNDLFNDFEAHVKKTRKRPEEVTRAFTADIRPTIGSMLFITFNKDQQATTRAIIKKCLDPIVERGSSLQANKTLALLKQVFSYGVSNGYLNFNPLRDTKRENIGGKEKERKRFLSESEIHIFWNWLNSDSLVNMKTRSCLQILLLTGCRVGEVCKAEWSHIDLKAKLWHFPETNTKSHKGEEKPHTVPLNEHLITILNKLKETYAKHNSKYIFPFTGDLSIAGTRPITERSIAHFVNRRFKENTVKYHGVTLEKIVPHDLRRTVASHLRRLKVDPIVVEKILNHELVGMQKVYDQYDYIEERREALSNWANVVFELVAPTEEPEHA